MILIPFPEMRPFAQELASEAGVEANPLEWHRFPDGESLITLPSGLEGSEVAILATLRDPDHLALPLWFAAETAREMGARRVGLIAPYLGYMRQDRRFKEGQAVSAPLFARFLTESFDWLVTVDPHLHRIASLKDAFRIPAVRVAAAPELADWIRANLPDAVLFGPDSESQQWVAEVARLAGRPYEVLHKNRFGDRDVEVSIPQTAAQIDGLPVILDDIASSGRTMVQAVEKLIASGTRPPVCLIIHAVFADEAYEDILAAGASRIVTTNTIPHRSNGISVAGPLARGLSGLGAAPTGQERV